LEKIDTEHLPNDDGSETGEFVLANNGLRLILENTEIVHSERLYIEHLPGHDDSGSGELASADEGQQWYCALPKE